MNELSDRMDAILILEGKKKIIFIVDVVIVVILFLSLDYLTQSLALVIDLNPVGRSFLGSQTVEMLQDIREPVKITVFTKREGEEERIRKTLDLFAKYNGLIEYELVNMDRNPGRAQEYDAHSYYTTVIEYKGRRIKTGFPSKENMSDALFRCINREKKEIAFLSRPGEVNLCEPANNEHGYDFARMRLIEEGYRVKAVSLAEVGQGVSDFEVGVFIGVKRDFNPSECAIFEKMLKRGVRVILFLDPVGVPNLENMLRQQDIDLPRRVVVDKEGHPPGWDDYSVVVPMINREHAITASLESPLVFPLCRPVEVIKGESMEGVELLGSGRSSWAACNGTTSGSAPDFDQNCDKIGPICVGVCRNVGTGIANSSELIVFGNSRFFDNTYIKYLDNGRVFTNIFEYATRNGNSQADVTAYGKALVLNEKQLIMLQAACISMPLAVIVVGIAISIKRRRSKIASYEKA